NWPVKSQSSSDNARKFEREMDQVKSDQTPPARENASPANRAASDTAPTAKEASKEASNQSSTKSSEVNKSKTSDQKVSPETQEDQVLESSAKQTNPSALEQSAKLQIQEQSTALKSGLEASATTGQSDQSKAQTTEQKRSSSALSPAAPKDMAQNDPAQTDLSLAQKGESQNEGKVQPAFVGTNQDEQTSANKTATQASAPGMSEALNKTNPNAGITPQTKDAQTPANQLAQQLNPEGQGKDIASKGTTAQNPDASANSNIIAANKTASDLATEKGTQPLSQEQSKAAFDATKNQKSEQGVTETIELSVPDSETKSEQTNKAANQLNKAALASSSDQAHAKQAGQQSQQPALAATGIALDEAQAASSQSPETINPDGKELSTKNVAAKNSDAQNAAQEQGQQANKAMPATQNAEILAAKRNAQGNEGQKPDQQTQTADDISDNDTPSEQRPIAESEKPAIHQNDRQEQLAKLRAPKGTIFSQLMAGVQIGQTASGKFDASMDSFDPMADMDQTNMQLSGTPGQDSSVRLMGFDAFAKTGTLPNATSLANAQAIAAQISRHVRNGENRFEIRLDPAELGKIDVRLTIGSDGQTRAHLFVERPETMDFLMRDQRMLERTLQQSGLQLDDQGLEFSLMDQQNQNQQSNDHQDQSADQGGQVLASDTHNQAQISQLEAQNAALSQTYMARDGVNLVI
ncbi:MAG: flagellar hook-length control protein FliK, partial [Cohaesibacter sp.]|nr:flagellar hook-length control protein FliK [Cohaesibacter sp.]